ncbi:hypothetical protein L596_014570 [Steinernema carpocapsae]|uniref:Uncharacterized protein n=1 Tax=Steinernema carpocapsae TaxID=34508 RepID=A0A4U5ND66_STECR|nr:hypothetical protein L596_014570 [Steinernema carpocapsae]
MEADYNAAPKPRTMILDFLMYPKVHRAITFARIYLQKRRFRYRNAVDTLVFFASQGFERLFELFFHLNYDQFHPLKVLLSSFNKPWALRITERELTKSRQMETFWKRCDRGLIIAELRRRPGIVAAANRSSFTASVVKILLKELHEWHLEKLDRWYSEYGDAEPDIYWKLRGLKLEERK